MSGRGGGRGRGVDGRGRGSIGGAGRGQPLTPAGRTSRDVPPPVFGSVSDFPALGSSSAARPVVSWASAAAGPSRPLRSASGGSGSAASASRLAHPVVQLQNKVEEMMIAPRGPPSSSNAISLPLRPGTGKAGFMRTIVKANHFLVKVATKNVVHHYDVLISPEVKSKKVNRDIMKKLQQDYKTSHLGDKMLAYDGTKSVYTAGALPFNSREFVVNLTDDRGQRNFNVVLKNTSLADVAHLQAFINGQTRTVHQEVIQALDVVLRETPSTDPRLVVVGRSFFDGGGERGRLGNGVEFWRGFYQSLRPTQNGLSLNIDVSATGFYQDITVDEFVATYLNINMGHLERGLSEQDRIKVKKVMRKAMVEVTHTLPDRNGNRRRYRITDLTTQPLSQLSFSHNGADTSIVRYFFETYQLGLRHTALPALVSGSSQKPILLPMEVCKIVPGQKYPKKLNERQVTELLRASCQRPQDRESGIQKIVNTRNFRDDDLLTQFGFQISTQLTSINARVLESPKIKYHDSGRESFANPAVGQWNMINKKMVNGGKVGDWWCVSFSRNVRASEIWKPLVEMCIAKGMAFHPKPAFEVEDRPNVPVEKILKDLPRRCQEKSVDLELLIIILPDISGKYGMIKRICETELGIISQCLNPRKASRSNQQYFENVALKINAKVGGRNSVLQQPIPQVIPLLTNHPAIIFGADVTHPQPGEDSAPSIASVVASMDWPEVTKYRSLVSAQPHRKEIIQDLKGMIRDHLIAFHNHTGGRKPKRIIFYRDGVSEGQFKQVVLEEVDAIRKACDSVEKNYLPPVTFVVVQKRHHTRLFPTKRGDTDRSGNILPGTVVDTDICHPTEFDFYLCSHAGIKGTSRPTHYHVLYDENKFDADSLQRLTYNLCYTYARCTRAVSIVPPAYYAHLAAYRARYYVEGLFSDNGSQTAGRAATREQEIQPAPLPAIKGIVKERMFYC